MKFFGNLSRDNLFKGIIAIISLIVIIYICKNMINLLLPMIVLMYVFNKIHARIFRNAFINSKIGSKTLTIFIYTFAVAVIAIIGIYYIPYIAKQLVAVVNMISNFNFDQLHGRINDKLLNLLKEIDIHKYIGQSGSIILEYVKDIGSLSINLVLAFLLSFIFLLEKEELISFGKKIEKSKISYIYNFIKQYGTIFLNSFCKVIETQIAISGINSILSIVALAIMGFPQFLGLGIMIFLLGLIPVAGVIISLVPLGIIAFSIGGIMKVIEVVIMIAVLHALESYVLNPKLMSVKMHIPVFLVFLILLVSEKLIGIPGLLIGIPLFMFFLHVFDINLQDNRLKVNTKPE